MTLNVSYAQTRESAAPHAVEEMREQLGADPLDAVIFYCDPDLDLETLGPALKAAFDCPVIGCTASGQIGPNGFQATGILAAGLRGGDLRVQPHLISPLSDRTACASSAVDAVQSTLVQCDMEFSFGLLLVDGLSLREEQLAASLYQALGDVPLIGGSAGDNQQFRQTHVYYDGRFLQNAAVLAQFECAKPCASFKFQHFVPSDIDLVITEADPERRLIIEIDGEPAARAYADAIGLTPDQLDANVFSTHPLLMTIGGDPYVRSIRQVNEDLSLTCYCAVDEGRVVSVGNAVDVMKTLEEAFDGVRETVPDPALILGCDCILRRVEFEQNAMLEPVGQFMASRNVFGFSTYGEQFNGLHINQTFTGIAIGA
ncbi:FIST N-terminal domain-containing protein [uncultured Abyssibacter sp.]|uniref:FIST N-terminal domain-containing protein n=1 Tax=uncultured Abyssibacter sp. TaxID=2320202 RepID=UPI0032B29322